MKIATILVTFALIPSSAISQQGFTCSYGDRGACLCFGETVCSSSGMCVSEDSACFDRYQCNYEGFTCRSNVTECVERNEQLLGEHNDLVRDYNALLEEHRTLLTTHNDLVDDYNLNLAETRELKDELADIEYCLIYASTLEDAQLCTP